MVTTTVALGLTIATLIVFTGLGLWYSRGRIDSVEDFITARNTTGGGMTTATLIASALGAWILLSPAEAGAAFGGLPAVMGYAIGQAAPLLLFISVGTRIRTLLPEGHSLTEYTLVRFGSGFYVYVLVITIFYMFMFLASEMTGIALALGLIAEVPTWQTATLIGGFVLVYTAYGGLVASIFTDSLQTLVVLPLLVVGLAGAILSLGGAGEIHGAITSTQPQLLDPGFLPGVAFGLYVTIAVMGSNMMNQGLWQRVFAAGDTGSMRRSFGIAALAAIPMLFLAGLFGVAATGLGLVESGNASIAFFLVLNEAFPEWVTLVVVILAILLVMSSADTMFNGLSSMITADLPLLLDDPDQQTLTLSARALTVVVAIAAIAVGSQGYSVLMLFLTADLFAVATFIPVLHGFYSEQPTGGGGLVASVAGLVVGMVYFPYTQGLLSAIPGVAPLLPGSSFVHAFFGAAAVSGVLSVVTARLTSAQYDLDRLSHEIRALDEPTGSADQEVSD